LIECSIKILSESAQAAVNIMQWHPEPVSGEKGKHRVAQNPVEKWHCSGEDRSATRRKTATLHEIKSLAQFGNESWNLQKVVTVVSIAHDDKFATRRGYSVH